MRDRAWLGMLTATACDAGIDRWADMRDAESGIRDPGSGMIPKEGHYVEIPAVQSQQQSPSVENANKKNVHMYAYTS